MFDSELKRLLGRVGDWKNPQDLAEATNAWDKLVNSNGHAPCSLWQRQNALTLVQSASFMARGREEAR